MRLTGIIVAIIEFILNYFGIGTYNAFYVTFLFIADIMTVIGIITLILWVLAWLLNGFNGKLCAFGFLSLALFWSLDHDYPVYQMGFREYVQMLVIDLTRLPNSLLPIIAIVVIMGLIIYFDVKICFGLKRAPANAQNGRRFDKTTFTWFLSWAFISVLLELFAYIRVYPAHTYYLASAHLYFVFILVVASIYYDEKRYLDQRGLMAQVYLGGKSLQKQRFTIAAMSAMACVCMFYYSGSVLSSVSVSYGLMALLYVATEQEVRKSFLNVLVKIRALWLRPVMGNRERAFGFGTYHSVDQPVDYAKLKACKEWGVVTIKRLPSSSRQPSPESLLQEFDRTLGIRVLMSNITTIQVLVPPELGRGKSDAMSVLDKLQQKYNGLSGEVGCMTFTKEDYRYLKYHPYFQLKSRSPVLLEKVNLFQTLSVLAEKIPKGCYADIFLIFNARQPQYKIRVINTVRRWEKYLGAARGDGIFELWKDRPYAMDLYFRVLNQSKDTPERTRIALDTIALDLEKEFSIGNIQKVGWDQTWRDAMINIINLRVSHGIYVTNAAMDIQLTAQFHKIGKAQVIPRETINPIDIPSEDGDTGEYRKTYLPIGNAYLNGVLSSTEAHLTYDQFAANALVIGLPGTGKTSLINYITTQFCINRPDVGILVINVAKKNEYERFKNFIYYALGEHLSVPYFAIDPEDPNNIREAINRVGKNLSAIFGLPDYSEILVQNPLNEYYGKWERNIIINKHPVPSQFTDVLTIIQTYISRKENQFEDRVQINIMQIIKQTIEFLLNEPKFMHACSIKENQPEWLKKFLNGGKVFIDLNGLDERIQNAVFLHILQLLDVSTRNRNNSDKTRIQNLVVMDEAHVLLSKPMGIERSDDRFRRQYRVGDIFIQMLREFRSRGLGFMISDQQATELIEGLPNLIKTKIMFKSSYQCALMCSGDEELARFIESQPDFHCVVLDSTGITQRYQIKTHPPERPKTRQTPAPNISQKQQQRATEPEPRPSHQDISPKQAEAMASSSVQISGHRNPPQFEREPKKGEEMSELKKFQIRINGIIIIKRGIDLSILDNVQMIEDLLTFYIQNKDIEGLFGLVALVEYNKIIQLMHVRLGIPLADFERSTIIRLFKWIYREFNEDGIITAPDIAKLETMSNKLLPKMALIKNKATPFPKEEFDKYYAEIDALFGFITQLIKKWYSWLDSKMKHVEPKNEDPAEVSLDDLFAALDEDEEGEMQ